MTKDKVQEILTDIAKFACKEELEKIHDAIKKAGFKLVPVDDVYILVKE